MSTNMKECLIDLTIKCWDYRKAVLLGVAALLFLSGCAGAPPQ